MSGVKIFYSLDTLDQPVELLYSLLSKCAVFTFKGTLGAGKTTLIRSLLRRCGVQDTIISPTFTYMAAYFNADDQALYHFDLYRLKTQEEFFRAGFDEFIYSPNSWAFIEWPELIMPLLVQRACHVSLDYYTENQRVLTYTLSPDLS
jgi:tRNA threonylcarbamoyladenosine biosynthesis protein TsaE